MLVEVCTYYLYYNFIFEEIQCLWYSIEHSSGVLPINFLVDVQVFSGLKEHLLCYNLFVMAQGEKL